MRYRSRCASVLLFASAITTSASGQATTYSALNATNTGAALDCVISTSQIIQGTSSIVSSSPRAGVIDPLEQFTCPSGSSPGGSGSGYLYMIPGGTGSYEECLSTDPVLNTRRGLTHVVLSTGNANYQAIGAVLPEPGTQYSWLPVAANYYDRITLAVTLVVPANATTLAFDWRMLTAEFPEANQSSAVGKDRFSVTIQTTSSGIYPSAVPFGSDFPVDTATQPEYFSVQLCNTAQLMETGFDIVSTTPSSSRNSPTTVDNGIGPGRSDAGAQRGWRTSRCQVREGDTVTVRFTLEDHGDAMVDTAIYLDFLRFQGIIVADARSFLDGTAGVFTRPATPPIDDTRESFLGVGADGEARLLLTCQTPAMASGAPVTWRIAGATSPLSGTLYGVLESNSLGLPSGQYRMATSGPSVTSNWWSNTIAGSSFTYSHAIYRAPADFATAPTSAASRTVTIEAVVGGTVIKTIHLTVVRPPVVLSHGFTGSPAVWNGFGDAFLASPKHIVHRANWSATHMDSYWANRGVVERESRAALDRFALSGYLGIQVDWMGHSMGGCLPRYAESRTLWANDQNYMRGYIHKLILGNSPQAGSPWANTVLPFIDAFNGIPLIPDIPTGAFESLSVGSDHMDQIRASTIPTHALYGSQSGHNAITLFDPAGHNILLPIIGMTVMEQVGIDPFTAPGAATTGASVGLGAFLDSIPGLSLILGSLEPTLFPSHQHDLIVSAASQKAGLSASAVTNMDDTFTINFGWVSLPLPNPFAANHIGANKAAWTTSSSMARHTRLDQLLDYAKNSPQFALPSAPQAIWGWPGNTTGSPTSMPVPATPGATPSTAFATFWSISPGSNVAQGGDTITLVAFAGDNPPSSSPPWAPIEAIFKVGPCTTRVSTFVTLSPTARQFTGTITLPLRAFGSLPIEAVFSDATGRSWGCVSPTTLEVGWGVLNLEGLTTRGVVPTLTVPLQKVSLEIAGVFADGSVRPMEGAQSGLQFAVHETSFPNSNTPVLTMTPDGAIIPRRDGDVELVVTNSMFASGTRRINIPIKVRLEAVRPYGVGLAGATGLPILDTDGQVPSLGNSNFRLRTSNARPASAGLLLWSFAPGNYPLPNGSAIFVDLAGPFFTVSFTTSQSTTTGTGSWVLPFPLPWTPALEGLESYLQAAVVDPGAPGGVALTNALYISCVTQ